MRPNGWNKETRARLTRPPNKRISIAHNKDVCSSAGLIITIPTAVATVAKTPHKIPHKRSKRLIFSVRFRRVVDSTAVMINNAPITCKRVNLSLRYITDKVIMKGLYMEATMAHSPGPMRFRLLKKSVSPIPRPITPLARNKRYSPPGTWRTSGSPKIHMVGRNRIAAKRFLKRFKAMG